jgi:hypothetical protein
MTTVTFLIAPHDFAVAAAVIALVVLSIIRWRWGLAGRTWLPVATAFAFFVLAAGLRAVGL